MTTEQVTRVKTEAKMMRSRISYWHKSGARERERTIVEEETADEEAADEEAQTDDGGDEGHADGRDGDDERLEGGLVAKVELAKLVGRRADEADGVLVDGAEPHSRQREGHGGGVDPGGRKISLKMKK